MLEQDCGCIKLACVEAKSKGDQDKRSLHVFEKDCWGIKVACVLASGRSDQDRNDLCMCLKRTTGI